MADSDKLKSLLAKLRSEVTELISKDVKLLQEDMAKVPAGGDLLQVWDEGFSKLESSVQSQRQEVLSALPPAVAKVVDDKFNKVFPSEATNKAKELVSGSKLNTSLDKLKKEVVDLSGDSIMNSDGLTRLSRVIDETTAAISNQKTASSASLGYVQNQLGNLLSSSPETMFSSLTSLKTKSLDALAQLNYSSAVVAACFGEAQSVLDQIGITDKLDIDVDEIKTFLAEIEDIVGELDRVILFSQSELSNRGVVNSTNIQRSEYLMDSLITRLQDMEETKKLGMLGSFGEIANLSSLIDEPVRQLDSILKDVDDFVDEVEKVSPKIPGGPLLRSKVDVYGKFRTELNKFKQSIPALLNDHLPSLDNLPALSERMKSLMPSIPTAQGNSARNILTSDSLNQKNTINLLKDVTNSVTTPLKNLLVGSKQVMAPSLIKDPSDMLDPSSVNFRPTELTSLDNLKSALTDIDIISEGNDLKTKIKSFEVAKTRFEQGIIGKSALQHTVTNVINTAQTLVSDTNQVGQAIAEVTTPVSKELTQLKKIADYTTGVTSFSELMERGKYHAAMNLDWADMMGIAYVSGTVEEIKSELMSLEADVDTVENTLTTLSQRVKAANKSGVSIVSEFVHAAEKIKNMADYRVSRMKRLKDSVDNSETIIKATIDKLK